MVRMFNKDFPWDYQRANANNSDPRRAVEGVCESTACYPMECLQVSCGGILSGNTKVCSGHLDAQPRKRLPKLADIAESITYTGLPSIEDIHVWHCMKKAADIIKDHGHPDHALVSYLTSDRRCRNVKSGTSMFKSNFTQQLSHLILAILSEPSHFFKTTTVLHVILHYSNCEYLLCFFFYIYNTSPLFMWVLFTT